jgi:DNA-binding response OmpR family regulator
MKPIKVLYVEDEAFLGKIVKESLESRGYEIWMEEDGTKAMERFRVTQPDICVLDIMVPGIDGYELAQQVRKANSKMLILFLTAKSQTEDVVKGFKSGGNDFIRKPFSMEELIVRIENLLQLNASDNGNEDTLHIGSFTFHSNRQQLTDGNTTHKLSHRESELLRALYHNKDRIIDRREILNLLWGNDNFFNSRNLDVYITKLRSYLRTDPAVEILTIKGVGYRFISP